MKFFSFLDVFFFFNFVFLLVKQIIAKRIIALKTSGKQNTRY